MIIQTKRLLLRPLEEGDLDDLNVFYSDEETCRYLLIEPWNEADKNEHFKQLLNNRELSPESKLNLACVLDDHVIGNISIWYTDMKDTVELGYTFNPDYHHQGYAFEALKAVIGILFSEYKVHRLQTVMDARNRASAALSERLGMRKEAHFIKDFWSKNEWTDTLVYGLLKEEYESNKE